MPVANSTDYAVIICYILLMIGVGLYVMRFNNIASEYLVFRRAPWWSGMATFATGLMLGILGDFVFKWTFIEQIIFVVPAAFTVFFLSMLFDQQQSTGRDRLFKKLGTPSIPRRSVLFQTSAALSSVFFAAR
jgi:hypothetical protein